MPLEKNDVVEALRKSRLDVHLNEYKALRDEILKRLDTQRQAFNYTVVVLGAVVTGLGVLIGKGGGDSANLALLPHLSLLLPLIVGPLAFIFFDDELVMYRDIFHICQHTRYRVAAQLVWDDAGGALGGDARLAYDTNLFLVEAKGFGWLTPASQNVHPFLSTGRWLLFILPVAAPPLNFAIFCLWGGGSVPDHIGGLPLHLTWLWVLPLAADAVILTVLLWAVYAVLLEQAKWRASLNPVPPGSPPPPLPEDTGTISFLSFFRRG